MVATLRRWLKERRDGDICLAARTNRLLSGRYRELLEGAGIACVVVEKDSDAELARDAVRLATMHRMKGLEFSRVLLAGVQEGQVPMVREAADEAGRADQMLRERCLFYVAATRARDELVVTGAGGASAFLGG